MHANTTENCGRSAESSLLNKQTLSCVSPSFVSPYPSECTKTIASPWAMHSFVERRTQGFKRSELCQAAAWGILRYWRKMLHRFILGLQNTVNDTKHDTVKRCVKQKFDVGRVCCEEFCRRPDTQECSSCSGSLMRGDRATLWRCGQMTVPWEEICHRQPMRCCRFRVTVQSVI